MLVIVYQNYHFYLLDNLCQIDNYYIQVKHLQDQFNLNFFFHKLTQTKKIEDYQLNELEEEMKEIAAMQSIKQKQDIQKEQQNAQDKDNNNFNDESNKQSEKKNDTQVQALVYNQVQQGSQLQMIQQIVNFDGTMKMVNISLILNILLALWIFLMLFVNSYLVNNEIQTYFHQLAHTISYQSLQFYVGVPYTLMIQLLLSESHILNCSTSLQKNTISKLPFLYGYSQLQQSQLQSQVCTQPKYYSKYFDNINDCYNFTPQFQIHIVNIKLIKNLITQYLEIIPFAEINPFMVKKYFQIHQLILLILLEKLL